MAIIEMEGTLAGQSAMGGNMGVLVGLAASLDAVSALTGTLIDCNVANLDFEVGGPNPGDAIFWNVLTKASKEEYAAFNQSSPPTVAFDGFELGWGNDDFKTAFELADLSNAQFDQSIGVLESFEDFEEGWLDNQNFSDELVSTAAAVFDSAIPEAFEDFEEEWDNDPFLVSFTPVRVRIDIAADGEWRITFGVIDENSVVSPITASFVADGDNETAIAAGLAAAVTASAARATGSPSGATLTILQDPSNSMVLVDELLAPGGGAGVIETDLTSGSLDFADFDTATEQVEDFEEEWGGNENYLFGFVGPGTDLTFAEFDDDLGPTEQFENYEDGWPTVVMETI